MKRRAENREGFVGINLSLPPALHRRLAIASVEDQVSMSEILRAAVLEWLDRRDKKGKGKS